MFTSTRLITVIGKTLRLHSIKNQNQIGCFPLKKVSEVWQKDNGIWEIEKYRGKGKVTFQATFRWVVYTNTSLSAVQQKISEKTKVPAYKVT